MILLSQNEAEILPTPVFFSSQAGELMNNKQTQTLRSFTDLNDYLSTMTKHWSSFICLIMGAEEAHRLNECQH